MTSPNIWLIGAGPMAIDYANVLKAQEREFCCITRSLSSAADFFTQTECEAQSGGLQKFLSNQPDIPEHVIVATGIEMLSSVAKLLLDYGIKSILLEKPGGLDLNEIKQTLSLANDCHAKVYVAYNRRFYASVEAAQRLIAEDGGATSVNYEITEWSHVIEKTDIAEEVKNHWFIANTSHVVDLAFYLGGKPRELAAFTSGATSWHNSSANFSGAGVTETNALFAYHGNWNAPGRWFLEVSTDKRRFIFRPLEQLKVQMLGSVAVENVEIDDQFDRDFKPGLYQQTASFLAGSNEFMCDLEEHLINMKSYYKMANYTG